MQYRFVFTDLALLIVLTLVQLLFIRFISIGTVSADIVLPGLVYFALRRGQIHATAYGFISGLLIDLPLGGLIGVSSLAKTIAGFTAGFFHDEEKTDLLLRGMPFLWITLLSSFLHNIVFVFTTFVRIDIDLVEALLLHVFGATIYTVIISLIPLLILSRTGTRLKV